MVRIYARGCTWIYFYEVPFLRYYLLQRAVTQWARPLHVMSFSLNRRSESLAKQADSILGGILYQGSYQNLKVKNTWVYTEVTVPLGSRIVVRSSIFGHCMCYVTRNEVFIYHSPIRSSANKELELLKAFSINLSESQMETNQTCKSLLKCKCRCVPGLFS